MPNALVGVIMGSDSDLAVMRPWSTSSPSSESRSRYAVSAHRTPDVLYEYASTAADRGLSVIAGAGGAAHLPGMTASMTPLPVIGVLVPREKLDGVDSLLSIVQMPPGSRWPPSASARPATPGSSRSDPRGDEPELAARCSRSSPSSPRPSARRTSVRDSGSWDGSTVRARRARPSRWPSGWKPAAILTSVTLVDSMDQGVVPGTLSLLQDEWGFSDTLGGAIPTAAFVVGFPASSPLLGGWPTTSAGSGCSRSSSRSWALPRCCRGSRCRSRRVLRGAHGIGRRIAHRQPRVVEPPRRPPTRRSHAGGCVRGAAAVVRDRHGDRDRHRWARRRVARLAGGVPRRGRARSAVAAVVSTLREPACGAMDSATRSETRSISLPLRSSRRSRTPRLTPARGGAPTSWKFVGILHPDRAHDLHRSHRHRGRLHRDRALAAVVPRAGLRHERGRRPSPRWSR